MDDKQQQSLRATCDRDVGMRLVQERIFPMFPERTYQPTPERPTAREVSWLRQWGGLPPAFQDYVAALVPVSKGRLDDRF
jgi:hypothetical protein